MTVSHKTHNIVSRDGVSVWQLGTGWVVRGSNFGEGEIFRTHQEQTWGPPGLLLEYWVSFLGVLQAERPPPIS